MTYEYERLGGRGRLLWDEMNDLLEFDSHEVQLLVEVCRTLDTIDALAESIDLDGVMIEGSQGQQVLNQAVGELRQQQQSFARLVAMLNLGDVANGAGILSAASVGASQAANARWAKHKVAKRG